MIEQKGCCVNTIVKNNNLSERRLLGSRLPPVEDVSHPHPPTYTPPNGEPAPKKYGYGTLVPHLNTKFNHSSINPRGKKHFSLRFFPLII